MTGGAGPGQDGGGRPSVAIFGSRETAAELLMTVRALTAIEQLPLSIDLLCNGDPALPRAVAAGWSGEPGSALRHRLRIWHLPAADKANAWNQHLHAIWSGRGPTVYLDGHCRVDEASLVRLLAALQRPQPPLAASAVPTHGRTADQRRAEMLREGGLVGEFLAIGEPALARLKHRGIRLPLGLYGFDALLGAMFAYDLDPRHNAWDLQARVAVCADSTWITQRKRWLQLRDLRAQGQRRVRIALRQMVNAALDAHFTQARRLPEDLPPTCLELVEQWSAQQPAAFSAVLSRDPLCHLALKRLRQPRDWSARMIEPTLVLDDERLGSLAQPGWGRGSGPSTQGLVAPSSQRERPRS